MSHGIITYFTDLNHRPPPTKRPPWDLAYRDGIDFTYRGPDGERSQKVRILLSDRQPTAQRVESQVRSGVKYPIEMALPAEAIDFGYLQDPATLVVGATRTDPHTDGIRMTLNLKRLEMEIRFPVSIKSKGKSTERAYRFFVALDDQFSLIEVPGTASSALIIHVKNPPWYSRQLKEALQLSHDPNSFKWNADDTWSRQTDIVDEKENFHKIDNSPVSLQKLDNSINISRWTTFRLIVKASRGQQSNPLRQFLTALQDFNIHVTRDPRVKIIRAPAKDAPIWTALDGGSSPRSLSEQLSLPHLDFALRYQLEVCISKGWLNEYSLSLEFLHRLTEMPAQRAKQMLVHIDSYEKRVYDPMSIFSDLRYTRPVRAHKIPSGCAEIYHATITATGIIFHTPSVEITNRIVRKYQQYSDRFLRVRFEDDSYRGKTKLFPATNGKMKLIFERVRRVLRNGILIGDRHYEFLAWGNSQLREHGTYFFASSRNPRITADDIRRDMGSFVHEKVVARRAARMGQCFSTTVPVPVLGRNSWRREPIPDIMNGEYNFTDGVGKISSLAAYLVKEKLKLKGDQPPSAFQFRLGGCKGVLTVDPALSGINVQIRRSQYKFDSDSDELEIIRVSEFWAPYLNRQLILVLSALGVPDHVFLQRQELSMSALEEAMVDDSAAIRALRFTIDPNLMTLNIAAMIEAGFSLQQEPFLASLLQLWRAYSLKSLKEKAKIPVSEGAFVLGVADETQTLRGHINASQPAPGASREERENSLPEIFLQYTDPQGKGGRRILEGVCIIARNPSLHKGDVRVVKAVNVPQLHHLCDVLVMPSVGDRDLPSMCSGGDLDGDDYIVIWDQELIPEVWNAEPFHYNAPKPIQKDEISKDDIINFFCDYMQNDFLGRIAVAHLAAADWLDDGIASRDCLKLVELHSMAVDYPKTGVPAEMSRDLERQNWPHFMEKRRAGVYRSRKILGQLYDAVERVKFEPFLDGAFDPRILIHPPTEKLMESIRKMKRAYDESMRRIMAQHQIESEFEVWSTFVLHHSKASGDYKFHEEIGQHAKMLREQYYDAFCDEAGSHDAEKLAPFAITAYHLTHSELREAQEKRRTSQGNGENHASLDSDSSTEFRMPFISFPWVLQDTLQKIATNTILQKENEEERISKRTSTDDKRVHDAGGDFDNEKDLRKWTYHGEHLPDPYVPIPADLGITQAQAIAAGDETLIDLAEDTPPQGRALPLGHSAIMLPICSKLATEPDHFTSDNSSMTSVNMPFSESNGKSVPTSPDEILAPLSALTRSSVKTGSSARFSNPISKNSPSLAALIYHSTAPSAQAENHVGVEKVEQVKPLQDPALMTEEETAAILGGGDDDEDFDF